MAVLVVMAALVAAAVLVAARLTCWGALPLQPVALLAVALAMAGQAVVMVARAVPIPTGTAKYRPTWAKARKLRCAIG